MDVFNLIQVILKSQGITWISDPNNTVDWTNQSGGTSSTGTGPSAADGLYYMYTETSDLAQTVKL